MTDHDKKDLPPTPESVPEEAPDKEPHPSKGAGRRRNVQLPPDEQRGAPDPKRKSPTK